MELNDLNIFLVVANEKSISKAAKSLGYAQSNISMRIKVLEEELGTKLLIRSAKGSELTQHGQRLYQHALGIKDIMNQINFDFSINQNLSSVTISAPQTILSGLMPQMVKAFQSSDKAVKFQLKIQAFDQLLMGLETYAIDIAILQTAKVRANMTLLGEFTELPVLVGALDYNNEPLPLILNSDETCPYRQYGKSLSSTHPTRFNDTLYFDTLDLITNSIIEGLGLSFLPSRIVMSNDKLKSIPADIKLDVISYSLVTNSKHPHLDALKRISKEMITFIK